MSFFLADDFHAEARGELLVSPVASLEAARRPLWSHVIGRGSDSLFQRDLCPARNTRALKFFFFFIFYQYSQITCDHLCLVALTAAYRRKADRSQLQVETLRVNEQSASLHRHQWDHFLSLLPSLSLFLASKLHCLIVRSTFSSGYLQHRGWVQLKCKKIANNHKGGGKKIAQVMSSCAEVMCSFQVNASFPFWLGVILGDTSETAGEYLKKKMLNVNRECVWSRLRQKKKKKEIRDSVIRPGETNTAALILLW